MEKEMLKKEAKKPPFAFLAQHLLHAIIPEASQSPPKFVYS